MSSLIPTINIKGLINLLNGTWNGNYIIDFEYRFYLSCLFLGNYNLFRKIEQFQ